MLVLCLMAKDLPIAFPPTVTAAISEVRASVRKKEVSVLSLSDMKRFAAIATPVAPLIIPAMSPIMSLQNELAFSALFISHTAF